MNNSGTEQRKLAAIMFTDMVGYTEMSQHNEPRFQTILKKMNLAK